MTYQDSLGNVLKFDRKPQKVISLVPSITEWLIDMGVEVVGRTKFCIHPSAAVADIPIVGGTKNFRLDTIDDIRPDLIVGNKEENYVEGINSLSKNYPVWITEINSFQDALSCFDDLSSCLDVSETWSEKRRQLSEKYHMEVGRHKGSLIYVIWRDPYMAVGKNTYVNSVLSDFGYQNVIDSDRYPAIEMEDIIKLDPDHLFLSSEPYPFKQKHVMDIQAQLPNTKVRLVDGEFYSWYGTRFLKLESDRLDEV